MCCSLCVAVLLGIVDKFNVFVIAMLSPSVCRLMIDPLLDTIAYINLYVHSQKDYPYLPTPTMYC